MKSLYRSSLVVALILGCVGPVNAQVIILPGANNNEFTFNFNESGQGSFFVRIPPGDPLNGSLLPDPSNGGAPALTFLLSAFTTPVANGDVRIFENVGQTILGDALRFTDGAGNLNGRTADRMMFYSALGGGLLADTGFPANLGTGLNTSVVENSDGTFRYVAFNTESVFLNTFNGVSTEAVVPEPTTLAIWTVLGSLAAVCGYRRRRPRE